MRQSSLKQITAGLGLLILCACGAPAGAVDAGVDAGPAFDDRLRSDSGSAFDATGTDLIGARAFPVANGVATAYGFPDGGQSVIRVIVELHSSAGPPAICDIATPATGAGLRLMVGYSTAGGKTLIPGTYAFALGELSSLLSVRDQAGAIVPAVSGSATLTVVTANRVAGSLQASMFEWDGGSSTLSGTFDVPGCP